MAYQATPALRAAWRIFWPTRTAVVLVAVFAALSFGPAQGEPASPEPLMSLPRFLAVTFPIFMWLALWCEERGATAQVAAFSAIGLGLFTAQFATWHWIS